MEKIKLPFLLKRKAIYVYVHTYIYIRLFCAIVLFWQAKKAFLPSFSNNCLPRQCVCVWEITVSLSPPIEWCASSIDLNKCIKTKTIANKRKLQSIDNKMEACKKQKQKPQSKSKKDQQKLRNTMWRLCQEDGMYILFRGDGNNFQLSVQSSGGRR